MRVPIRLTAFALCLAVLGCGGGGAKDVPFSDTNRPIVKPSPAGPGAPDPGGKPAKKNAAAS